MTSITTSEGILAEFNTKLEEYTARAACGKRYVRVKKLKTWLLSPGPRVGTGCQTNATHLLHAAYRHRSRPGLPIQPEDLSLRDECCLLIFSILLQIGCGDMIHIFNHEDKFDSHLPLQWAPVQSLFGPNRAAEAALFFKEQWRFCPARFDLHKPKGYPNNRVIPICSKELIKEGGTAQLWHISVHEEFVATKLREVASSSKFNAAAANEPADWRYEFALKTFKEGNRRLYDNEKEALLALKQHDGMVRWLGAYSHEDARRSSDPSSQDSMQESGTTTHNILLEFGESDLEVLFGEKLPPILPKEIEGFWASFFEVADAVRGIHYLKTGTGTPWAQDFHGWHSDIKPDNILKIGDKFKLADPGFARFKKVDHARGERPPEGDILGVTESYGAPESHQGAREQCRLPLPQAMDVWSLGCVFSEVATWIVLGYQGVKQYRIARKLQIRSLVNGHMSGASTRPSPQGLAKGDYFHDGRDVLQGVTEWHAFLRTVLRPTDTLTAHVLDLVDERMLLGCAKNRIKTGELCPALKAILGSDRKGHYKPIPSIVQEALLEIDQQAISRAADEKRSEPSSRPTVHLAVPDNPVEARKSKVREMPLMTTSHRTSALSAYEGTPPDRIPPHTPPRPAIEHGREGNGLVASPDELSGSSTANNRSANSFQNGSPAGPPSPPRHRRMSSDASQQSPTSRAQRQKGERKHPPQDVFQANEELDLRDKGLMNHLGRTKKDELLTLHFRERDIKFLVDNGESMKPNWYQAGFLLSTLVRKAKGQDRDGMDLVFTTGPVEVKGKDRASKFMDAMADAKPLSGTFTNMKSRLGDIFMDYMKDAEIQLRSKGKVKNMTLIIFTDGIWKGMKNKNDVDQAIINFVRGLEDKVKDYRERPFSIQFVQFGNDPDASYKLESLDRDLKWNGRIPDIVDTEHASGDVNKMLLGSFVEEYDDLDEDIEEEHLISLNLDSQITPQQSISRAPTAASTATHNRSSYHHNGLYGAQVHVERRDPHRQLPTLQEPPAYSMDSR